MSGRRKPLQCSDLLVADDSIVVTEESLEKAQNDIQLIVDCNPPKGTIYFAIPSITLSATIHVNKPLRIGVMNVSNVEIICPKETPSFSIQ